MTYVPDVIVQGFADACFISSWASAFEDEDCPHAAPWGPGAQIEDYAPTTPAEVLVWARSVCEAIQQGNAGRSLLGTYTNNLMLPGHQVPPTEHSFGWYVGMQWLGHGVGWADNHPGHDLITGWGEFSVTLDTETPLQMWVESYAAEGTLGIEIRYDEFGNYTVLQK